MADYLLIAEAILDIDADHLKRTANLELVESALAAPLAGFGDHELHPEAATNAAILCSRLVRNHPLPDGNKRIAYICMREFLARNDLRWQRPSDDEAAEMVEGLASRESSEQEFVAWTARHITQRP
ncbi:MAG: type II toxin-antitoxin system death-on-curing family toxin [Solirubrobacterales bacterium]|nr:type II toxin-antitoxin system death-on-curing family toxin [Solirubrobacterales bacterium]